MTWIGASALVLLAIVVFAAPRRWALLAMTAGVLFLTQGQALDVAGLTLYPMRCLELVGFIRVIVRREFALSKITAVDKALLAVYAYTTVVFLLRTAMGGGSSEAIAQVTTKAKIGTLVDAVLCYFAFRWLLTSVADFVWFLRGFALLLGFYVTFVSAELMTGHNPFAVVGGLPLIWHDNGRHRCSGSFGHPSLLGALGASFAPLFVGLASMRGNRAVALAGLGFCALIVFLADSGGPVIMLAVSMVAWTLWAVRRRMTLVRWTIVGMLALLALVMKAPLWYLPHKLSGFVGGAGWHRSELIDRAIEHIDEWWLAGMPLDRTVDWFFYKAMGAVDITNAYLVFGFDAGLPALLLFVALLVRAFRGLGGALATVRAGAGRAGEAEFLLWGLGATLAGHVANFLSITYWDQSYAIWFLHLAAMSGVARACTETAPGPVREATPGWWAPVDPYIENVHSGLTSSGPIAQRDAV